MSNLSNAIEDNVLFFEDLDIGTRFTSGGRTVTEADVVNFAGISGDFHALHMDAAYAAETPHGQRIAHGMLIVAMTSGLVAQLPVMRLLQRSTLGLASVECQFFKPTFIGDTIHVVLDVQSKKDSHKPDRGSVNMRRSILNQKGEIVLEGLWRIVVKRRHELVP